MASSTYFHSEEAVPPQQFMRLAEAHRLLDRFEPAAPVVEQSNEDPSVLPSSALAGARAVLAAIGLEAFAALCICSVWLLGRFLR